jgi:hypothetical protein
LGSNTAKSGSKPAKITKNERSARLIRDLTQLANDTKRASRFLP